MPQGQFINFELGLGSGHRHALESGERPCSHFTPNRSRPPFTNNRRNSKVAQLSSIPRKSVLRSINLPLPFPHSCPRPPISPMLTSPSYRRVCRFAVNCAEHRPVENNTAAAARVKREAGDDTLRCIFRAIFSALSFAKPLALSMVHHASTHQEVNQTPDLKVHFSRD